MPCSLITDSRMTFAEAIAGTQAPPAVLDHLCLVDVTHLAFDHQRHEGQLVVHEALRQDILDLFALMEAIRFPIAQVIPISRYGWSDDASMAANNTSAFNYRLIAGTSRMSAHAWGTALDINPLANPVIYADGRIAPPDAAYRPEAPGVFTIRSPVVREFLKRGWVWGGQFASFKDYHHFEKPMRED